MNVSNDKVFIASRFHRHPFFSSLCAQHCYSSSTWLISSIPPCIRLLCSIDHLTMKRAFSRPRAFTAHPTMESVICLLNAARWSSWKINGQRLGFIIETAKCKSGKWYFSYIFYKTIGDLSLILWFDNPEMLENFGWSAISISQTFLTFLPLSVTTHY